MLKGKSFLLVLLALKWKMADFSERTHHPAPELLQRQGPILLDSVLLTLNPNPRAKARENKI